MEGLIHHDVGFWFGISVLLRRWSRVQGVGCRGSKVNKIWRLKGDSYNRVILNHL